MSYLALARKWRPRTFAELAGQDSVVRTLRFALSEGRIHHAYLFTGIRGVGKTTVARILAKALNCERGVGPEPCGACTACREIDAGRFVDLIEVDAASRTKVDDTRELLDNVQYAPTRGRFKVYLIDEVHMLSAHSFNALLKTLEEPPPHVKFLLATTDPQKLPVTVLSRCLKLALRRLSEAQIRAHLAHVLEAEGVVFEEEALAAIARAAEGSVRDALSLLDQAIAHGDGTVRAEGVRVMLGAVAPDLVQRLLAALSRADGADLLAVADEAYQLGVDPESLLNDLMRALHELAVGQVVPEAASEIAQAAWAPDLTPETVQLYYEIGCLGRRQLEFAPDPELGLRMTLLRMLAFRPGGGAPEGRPVPRSSAPARARARPEPETAARETGSRARASETGREPETPARDAEASEPGASAVAESRVGGVLESLALTGLLKQIAMNAVLERSGDRVLVTIDPAFGNLLNKDRADVFKQAICAYYGEPVSVDLKVAEAPVEATPASRRRAADEAAHEEARAALASDPAVVALERTFDARINENSVRPRK